MLSNLTLYHAYTVWLFGTSNIKDVILPTAIFCASTTLSLPAALPSTNHLPGLCFLLVTRLPLALCWTYLTLLVFAISNQRRAWSVAEDALNKPWRPIPSGRISSGQATALLTLAVVPVWVAVSAASGVLPHCAVFAAMQAWYNDGGAHHASGLHRNVLSAGGYAAFFAGAVDIFIRPCTVAVPSLHGSLGADGLADLLFGSSIMFTTLALRSRLLLLVVLIASTMHAAEFRDEEGDAVVGRRTVLTWMGDTAARWSLVLAVGWWSVAAPALMASGGVEGYVLCLGAGGVLVRRLIEGLGGGRTKEGDLSVYRAWCVWLMAILVLPGLRPLVRDVGSLILI